MFKDLTEDPRTDSNNNITSQEPLSNLFKEIVISIAKRIEEAIINKF